MSMSRKIWYGETKCDFCKHECEHILYDGATILGPWAVMCERCFEKFGVGVGLGKGQKYMKDEETDEFVKIVG